MSKFEKVLIIFISEVLIASLISFFVYAKTKKRYTSKTEIVVYHDTAKIVDSRVVDSFQIIIPDLRTSKPTAVAIKNNVAIDTEILIVRDTIRDTLKLILPIEQVSYRWEDTAQIWISGYKPKLDSVKFYNMTPLSAAPKRPPTWGVDVGASVMIYNNKIIPVALVSANYDIRKLRFGLGVGTCYDGAMNAFLYGKISYIIK